MAKKEEKVVKENKVKKHFFKDFKAELKKVIWPTPKQLVNNTVAVIVIVVIVGVIVFVVDTVFKAINDNGITKLQSYVVEKFGEDKKEGSTESNNSNTSTSENATTNANTTTDGGNSTESNQE